jgi:four helix bundle protein
MASRIISERAFAFACRIVPLCEAWAWTGRSEIADLFDSGTSIGANAEEAEVQTKPDFIAKLAISKEVENRFIGCASRSKRQ